MAYKNKRHNGGKKNYDKRGSKTNTRNSTGESQFETNTSNPIEWWNRALGVYGLATRVPFTKLSGAKYDMTDGNVPNRSIDVATLEGNEYALPNMMRISYVPGIGVSELPNDASNIAFTSLFQQMFSKSSGVIDIAHYFVAMFTICTQSIVQNIALLKRALETANLYSAANLTMPRGLLTTLGFEPEDFINRQVEYTWKLNTRINLLNTMLIPKFIDVFERHYALARNIWADMDDVRAQFYAFVPECYYLFRDLGEETDEGYDGLIRAKAIQFPWADGHTLMTFDEMLDIIDHQIDLIRSSADYARVTGFLQKTFDTAQFVKLANINPGQIRVPVYDKTMLYQIHNLNMAGDVFTETRVIDGRTVKALKYCDITGDPVHNLIKYKPITTVEPFRPGFEGQYPPMVSGVNEKGLIMNFFAAEEVNDTNIMESSRLMSAWDYSAINYKVASDIGTEFVTNCFIYVADPSMESGFEVIKLDPYWYSSVNSAAEGEFNYGNLTLRGITNLIKFHMAPRVHLYSGHSVGEMDLEWTIADEGIIGDLLYWTNVSKEALNGLHTAALLSIFNISNLPTAK